MASNKQSIVISNVALVSEGLCSWSAYFSQERQTKSDLKQSLTKATESFSLESLLQIQLDFTAVKRSFLESNFLYTYQSLSRNIEPNPAPEASTLKASSRILFIFISFILIRKTFFQVITISCFPRCFHSKLSETTERAIL